MPTVPASAVTPLQVGQGFGAEKGFWQVFFTAPTGSRDASTYVGGIDEIIASYIDQLQHTLDIAAYEFNSPALTAAVLRAKARGVVVRVVTDDHDGLGDSRTTLHQLEAANIPIVIDNRSALMHDKFMIMDSTWVVTGSWNFTVNDTYRNNNNALVLARRRRCRIIRPSSTRCSSINSSARNRPPIRRAQSSRRTARRSAFTFRRKTTC